MPPVYWRIRDTVWKTRGRHWDYEFISTPQSPELPAWAGVVEDILGRENSEAGRSIYGRLVIEGAGDRVFVAARFLDPTRKDWTGRPVQHMTVWFPPTSDAESIPSLVPGNWNLEALRALDFTYGRDDVFDVTDEAVRGWRRQHAESLAAHISTIVRGTPDAELVGELSDRANWVFRTAEKKKAPNRRAQTSVSGPSQTIASEAQFPMHWLFLAVVGFGALVYFLTSLMT